MTMLERPTDHQQTDAMDRVPAAWLRQHAPEQLECQCPEACQLDHDN